MTEKSQIDIAFDLGAAAYSGGFASSSNPYDRETESELFWAWDEGWLHERNYYEGKL
ncbi:MAG: hypothetical protein KGM99_14845 [Burkholderiales bacterium]|nr:hypothetical protein [Burkholderiales bacterium]